MKLAQLLKMLSLSVPLGADREIGNISFHSKQVKPDDLFFAVAGYTSDGHRYIMDAVAAGASAVIGEKELAFSLPVPYIRVPNARLTLAKAASVFYGHPCQGHTMIGVTGTNGKTTTVHMIRHILEYAEKSCSLFGTVECYINGESFPSTMTTYDAVQIQLWLHSSQDENVVMEVSSHGLAQHRVDGIAFDYALFTNLSHEHLDFHHTMDHYFETKASLFHLLKRGGEAIINTNTDWGRKLKEKLSEQNTPVYTVGPNQEDTLQLMHVENPVKPLVHIREEGVLRSFQLSVPGHYNVWNAMGAILVARRMNIPFETAAEAMLSFTGAAGRFQIFRHPAGAVIVVDYAHTPDGVLQCLDTIRLHQPNRIIHIFGFRGRKDNTKWDIMMEISNRYCDKTILTLDDLNGIPKVDMLQWYKRYCGNTTVIEDRTLAISHAWKMAQPGDWIVITGKGPEPYQETFRLPASSDIETIQMLKQSTATKSSFTFQNRIPF